MELTTGQKAARTRKRRATAKRAAITRKRRAAGKKAALTRKRRAAGKKAARTRTRRAAGRKAAATRKSRGAKVVSDHPRFRFSVTCHTDDLAIVHCLRGLCEFAEGDSPSQIAWGGTGREEWQHDNNQVTFRFTDPKYRERFLQEALRVLPMGSWNETAQSNSDPASPQR